MKKNSIGLSTTIASWTRKLSLSLLMLGCLTNPSYGQTKAKEVEIIGNPVIKDDRVTVRVKVKDELDKPVMGLNDTDFNLKVDGGEVELKNKDWKSPEETVPPPAWIVVLLDLSGSMNQRDSRGSTKLKGAVEAISEFVELSAKRGGNTQIAIVPFGESGPDCEGYPVNNNTLNKFFAAGDFKLQNYLDYLAGLTPSASTNLYEPLDQAVRFLSNKEDSRFHLPEESKAPEPRLSIVLLSDGYHNKPNEERDFQRLIGLLQSKSEVVVHTLGYGLTPEELAKKYKVVSRRATRADLGSGKIPAEEFVDQEKLAQIAQATGGIAEFSGNAQDIAESLQVFLNSLLGEYEITYTHPNAERGSKHNISVIATSIESPPKSYTITVFGRSLSRPVRVSMIFCTLLLLGLGGILPFSLWAKKLKYEGMDD